MRRLFVVMAVAVACAEPSAEILPGGEESSGSAGTSTAATTTNSTSGTQSGSQGSESQTGGTTDPASATGDATAASTSGGTTGGTTDSGASGSSTGSLECRQADTESNDSEATTQAADDAECDAGENNIDGTLAGASDIDWFQYNGIWSCGGVDLRLTATLDIDAEVCLYWECTDPGDSPEQLCEGGSTADVTPAGRDGCCNTGAVSLAVDCDGDNQSVLVFASVTGGAAEMCTDYSVTYEGIAAEIL